MSGAEIKLPAGADIDSDLFWRELAAGRLLLPRCRACGRQFFPPLPACPHCASEKIEYVESDGRGSVYSWVRVHRTLDPDFADQAPYVIVAVDIEGGGRAMARLLGDEDGVEDGAPIQLAPYESDGTVLLGARPLADG